MSNGVRGALLVGSVPGGTVEDVFRTAGARLGEALRRVPDGEPGERDNWISFQRRVFDRHPDIEPAPARQDGYLREAPAYILRAGVDPSGVDLTPLGYADGAIGSYVAFTELRDAGVLPASVRFQVCLPTATACVSSFIDHSEQSTLEPVYEAALAKELRRIQDTIPHRDLAIQWDIAVELAMWEGVGGVFSPWFDDVRTGTLERIARMAARVDEDVELGFHLCYGDRGHQHFVQPKDTANLAEIARGITDRVRRPIGWLHLPVPADRDDDAYFAPLRDLRLPQGCELYLGLVHAEDEAGTRRRIEAARRVVSAFGVATECGLGRTPLEQIDGLLTLHTRVLDH